MRCIGKGLEFCHGIVPHHGSREILFFIVLVGEVEICIAAGCFHAHKRGVSAFRQGDRRMAVDENAAGEEGIQFGIGHVVNIVLCDSTDGCFARFRISNRERVTAHEGILPAADPVGLRLCCNHGRVHGGLDLVERCGDPFPRGAGHRLEQFGVKSFVLQQFLFVALLGGGINGVVELAGPEFAAVQAAEKTIGHVCVEQAGALAVIVLIEGVAFRHQIFDAVPDIMFHVPDHVRCTVKRGGRLHAVNGAVDADERFRFARQMECHRTHKAVSVPRRTHTAADGGIHRIDGGTDLIGKSQHILHADFTQFQDLGIINRAFCAHLFQFLPGDFTPERLAVHLQVTGTETFFVPQPEVVIDQQKRGAGLDRFRDRLLNIAIKTGIQHTHTG